MVFQPRRTKILKSWSLTEWGLEDRPTRR
jgi:hypothetical protein